MTEQVQTGWKTAEGKAKDLAQVGAIREQARQGGLRFEVYLPPSLAEWLLDNIERGVFVDPGDAAFAIFTEHLDLAPHADLRQEILRRSLQAAQDDPRPRISQEEMMAHLKKLSASPRPEPAVWRRHS
jgi:antitoxin ParD1/3/4